MSGSEGQRGWRVWWAKRRWYERNRRPLRRWRLARHAARGGFFVRPPVEGEVLEALDEGRLRIGEGSLLEPGCWLTLAPQARIEIGDGCFLNRNTMLAAYERISIGDHTMFANGCFVGDAEHRFDDPDTPVTQQGFTAKGPVEIGSNCWFGVQLRGYQRRHDRRPLCDRRQLRGDPGPAPGVVAAGAPARVLRKIIWTSPRAAAPSPRPSATPGSPGPDIA